MVYYPDRACALSALRSLEDAEGALSILDAAVTRLSASGTLEITDTAAIPGRREPCLSRAIFPPDVLRVPAIGPGTAAADAHFRDQGFDRNILKEIGENLPPGGAALVATVEEKWMTQFAAIVDPRGGIARFSKQTAE